MLLADKIAVVTGASPKELIDAAMRRMPKVTAQSATWHDADEGSEENGKESLTL